MKKRILAALLALVGTGTIWCDEPMRTPPGAIVMPVGDLSNGPSTLDDALPDRPRAIQLPVTLDPPSVETLGPSPAITVLTQASAPTVAESSTLPLLVIGDQQGGGTPRWWADAEYLFYFRSPQRVPATILTTGTAASQGILNQPGTVPVISGDVNYGTFNGLRFRGGCWCNQNQDLGVDASFLWLEQGGRTFTAASDGSVVLARPLVNALTGAEAAALVAFPGLVAGNLTMQANSWFLTSDANGVGNVYRDDRTWIDASLGFRYAYFGEQLRIVENQQFLAAGFGSFLGARLPAGATMTIVDRFATANNLYIGQLGLRGETARGRIRIGGSAKIGFGVNNQRFIADGSTSTGAATVPGGILFQPTFSRLGSNNAFVVVPESSGRIGYQITDRLQIFASYSMLYFSNMARPGTQIDRTINPTQVPSFQTFGAFAGPIRPTAPNNITDLFVHGIGLGLTGRY